MNTKTVTKTKQASLHERNIRRMLADDDYTFAKDFLTSVLQYIEENGDITPKQVKGVFNIRRSMQ